MRISREEYYLEIVRAAAKRGTCDRGRAGAIIVKEGKVISMGYAGAPRGLPHCDDVGHHLVEHRTKDGVISEHCLRTVHAEANAIIHAARFGIAVEGSDMYCTMFPCRGCSMFIVNAGILNVISEYDYQGSYSSKDLLITAGINFKIINPNKMLY